MPTSISVITKILAILDKQIELLVKSPLPNYSSITLRIFNDKSQEATLVF